MKKYFIKETGEEITFGDELVVDFSKEMSNGHLKHHHLECRFIPELVDILLEQDIIEEKDIICFEDDEEDEEWEEIMSRIDALEKKYAELIKMVGKLVEGNKPKKK